MDVHFPYQVDGRGKTAEAQPDPHIRELIEQVLFTAPGERPNRPTFGCGLMQLVFAPNSPELATATRFLIQGSLQQWLGHLIQVDAVEVEAQDSLLRVSIDYLARRSKERNRAEFERRL